MTAAPVLAPSLATWNNEAIDADELVGRLYRTGESAVLELTATFTPRERINLAMFCYRKSHLHRIGLAIAATCDLPTLVQALGTVIGGTLFTQSRERLPVPSRVHPGHRPKVSLAVATRTIPLSSEFNGDDDDLELTPDADERQPDLAEIACAAEIAELL